MIPIYENIKAKINQSHLKCWSVERLGGAVSVYSKSSDQSPAAADHTEAAVPIVRLCFLGNMITLHFTVTCHIIHI